MVTWSQADFAWPVFVILVAAVSTYWGDRTRAHSLLHSQTAHSATHKHTHTQTHTHTHTRDEGSGGAFRWFYNVALSRNWVGLKPGTGNEEIRNEEMGKWRNEQKMWAKLSRRPALETMVYLTERAVGWQDKEGRQIMGVTPAVKGLVALTVSSESTEPMERMWKVPIKGGKCTRCAYV